MLRHFYSDSQMAGVCIHVPIPTADCLVLDDYYYLTNRTDFEFQGNFRDYRVPQIEYITQKRCSECYREWNECRCAVGIQCHSAWLPPADTLTADELVRVRCVEIPTDGGSVQRPIYKKGVLSSEQRCEFTLRI